jgi:hypothetical protein
MEENDEAGSGIRLSAAFIGDAGGRNGGSGRTISLFDSGESAIWGDLKTAEKSAACHSLTPFSD